MTVQRYTWEDALIEAETLNILPTGAVNLCLRLARAINWEPKNGGPSELRWKNEDALKSVNSSRATYFRYRGILFETGFLTERKGNLVPLVPDLSQIETTKSQVETIESQIETGQSQIEHPYSEDTYTDDVLSEDSYSDAPVVADAPTSALDSFSFKLREDSPLSNIKAEPVYFVDLSGVTKTPESHIETAHEFDSRTAKDWQSIRKQRPLSKEENAYLNEKASAFMSTQRAARVPVLATGDEW